eukprot:scaffold154769_cov23-Prasinocladus_malaysianus.AAC.1
MGPVRAQIRVWSAISGSHIGLIPYHWLNHQGRNSDLRNLTNIIYFHSSCEGISTSLSRLKVSSNCNAMCLACGSGRCSGSMARTGQIIWCGTHKFWLSTTGVANEFDNNGLPDDCAARVLTAAILYIGDCHLYCAVEVLFQSAWLSIELARTDPGWTFKYESTS